MNVDEKPERPKLTEATVKIFRNMQVAGGVLLVVAAMAGGSCAAWGFESRFHDTSTRVYLIVICVGLVLLAVGLFLSNYRRLRQATRLWA